MPATSRSEARARRPGATRRVVRRYVALGDSFTAGAEGATPPEDEAARWPDELAATLGAANPALEYHNLAVAGASSTEVAAGQLDLSISLDPDLVTIFCGANDVLLSVRPDIDSYAATFGYMLERLQSEAPAAALMTATCPDFSAFIPFRPRSRERVARGLRELNEATRTVAAGHGVLCLDFAAHPRADHRGSFALDGYHPSPEGNRSAAVAFAQALEERFGFDTAAPHDQVR